MNNIKEYYISYIIVLILLTHSSYGQSDINSSEFIDSLTNRSYSYLVKEENSLKYYQVLERFDLIFVAHDNMQNLSFVIPGFYTHVLMYLGKDSNGSAYAL
jgi:hypothetical protein